MGIRYLVTGSQLGQLIALCELNPKEANKLLNVIVENQAVWESKDSLKADIKGLKFMFPDNEEQNTDFTV